ncbi:MFS transporter [Desulfosporosinus sp. PR]|uniref:MFS transporter n=1 Tax=Candidatus Desulfosporosinus nitrosoreducens TaxID=3401928 RepID=UPI0027F3038F|nr:MFS transporter [Desulfosporosinus sp. PR]MDQ7095431.1 MFS transporter [Desulfosporosinus sp. PR]
MTNEVTVQERISWNIVVIGTLSLFVDSWDMYLLSYVLVDISKAFNVTLAVAASTLLFTYLTRWFGALLIGGLANRIGRKNSLMVAIGIVGIFTILTGQAQSFQMLILIRLCFGIGMGGVYSAAGPFVSESVSSRRRGLVSGIFMLGFGLGITVAPLTYYLLYNSVGWRGLFLFGGLSLLLIPYIYFTSSESSVWLAQKEKTKNAPKIEKKNSNPLWKLFAPGFLGITLALIAIELGEFFNSYPFGNLLPTYLKTVRHFPIESVALAGTVMGIGNMVGTVLSGWVSDHIGRKRTYRIAYIVGLFPVIFAMFTNSINVIVVAGACEGLIQGGLGGLMTAYENEHYPTELRAAGHGFVHNLAALGGPVGTVLAAFLHNTIGFAWSISAIVILGSVLGLIGLCFTRETRGISLLAAGESSNI